MNARLTRAPAKLRTRRTLKRPKALRAPPGQCRRALENLFCTKCHCQVPLPHNSAPPPRATKSRIANGAEHRPRWVLRHRGAAGAGASRDRRSRSKHGGSPVRHPVLGDARGCASATCAEHSPTPHSKTVSARQLGRGCHTIARQAAKASQILLRRAIGFQAPALAASQQTTVNGQTFLPACGMLSFGRLKASNGLPETVKPLS